MKSEKNEITCEEGERVKKERNILSEKRET